MEKKNEFLIPVSGLALGSHSFQYEISDDFFVGMDYSEVQQGRVDVRLDIDRQETMLTLHFEFKGSVRVPCDRCADEFDLPIESGQDFFLKLGTENAEESDDVAVVSAELSEYDIRPLVYEYIILAIPMHRVHPEGECNPEVLAMLNAEAEAPAEEETGDDIDPRWAALKDIKLNDK
ncbi:MAG: DUF177 domain-containing protein [Bacteroidales bacterium]|nr:DUF177 domain-containing protein [Bacteroidales bacterium]MBQ8959545.1 DUF177 domain-containing protein [Bacteroidales bacterium]